MTAEGRKWKASAGWALLIALGISAPVHAGKSAAQRDWLARVKAQPLEFTLPADESEAAWARAKVWIATNSKLTIQHADETVIQTESEPTELYNRPRFTVVRAKLPDGSWRFQVSVEDRGPTYSGTTKALHTLAFEIATGEPYPE